MLQKWIVVVLMIVAGPSVTGCTTFNNNHWERALAHSKYPVDDREIITPIEEEPGQIPRHHGVAEVGEVWAPQPVP